MSDYRFGDDYKLNIYPEGAMDRWGEIDMDKVESVEVEWVEFIRKPDDKSRWHELFGTPERAARTIVDREVGYRLMKCEDYTALLEWLRGDAE